MRDKRIKNIFLNSREQKMEVNFNLFIEELKEKTGIELTVFSENGTFIAGDERVSFLRTDNMTLDKENGATFFAFRKNGVLYIGRIKGALEESEKYAKLILAILENYNFEESKLTKEAFYNSVFKNKLNYATLSRYKEILSIPDLKCFAMILSYSKELKKDVFNILDNYIEGAYDCVVELDEASCVFVKYIDKNIEEYQSSTEYAEFLFTSFYEEMGDSVKIAVGNTVKSIFELGESFSQASWAERMAKTVGAKGNVFSFKEYTFVKMLEDLPKEKLISYLEILLDEEGKEIFSDEEMISTAETFLDEDLNTSETSRKLFLHRNTLTYRLDKIEKQTGLNLRKFSDAVTFRLITILHKLVK